MTAISQHPAVPKTAPAPVHHADTWFGDFGRPTTRVIEEVSCRACLEMLRDRTHAPCHHQLTPDTQWEQGEPCDNPALPGSEYCEHHAAAHGDTQPLAQWEEAA